MAVSAELADRVSEALGALYRHPDQTLLAWYRYAIYAALVADHHPASAAARAWIDVLSVQHVLFCWPPYARTGWPATWVQPADLLGLAERSLQGLVDPTLVERQITRAAALADVIGEPVTSPHYPAWCVFEAALRTLQSAGHVYAHPTLPTAPHGGGNGAVGLDDASWYAAIAIAGSRIPACRDQGTVLPDRALAAVDAAAQLRWTFFWEWWLREAIPKAALIARSRMVL